MENVRVVEKHEHLIFELPKWKNQLYPNPMGSVLGQTKQTKGTGNNF